MKDKERKLSMPLSIRIRASTKQALEKLSREENRSLSYLIERSVREALKLKS